MNRKAGVIQLDGLDLRTITHASLREHIGIVSRNVSLHDTI